MIEFFNFSWEARIFITILLGFCVLTQTLVLVLNFYQERLSIKIAFKNLFEISILLEILVFSLLHGQIINGYKNGIVVASGYEKLRIIIFLSTVILSIIVVIFNRNLINLAVMPAALISLQGIENILGELFPWFFISGLIFFLIRSIKICISFIADIRTNITTLSVKHAIDTLNTGVLFCKVDGYILLLNKEMQNIMFTITGKIFRNAIDFYEVLVSDKYKSRYKKDELDGQIVYILPDGRTVMFTKTDILIQMKKYIHLSVADVTELWTLTSKLKFQEEELRNKSNEIKETMANLNILSKRKQIENSKILAHGVLGQRLSMLLRIIQNENIIDYNLLRSLSKGLLEELKADHYETDSYEELKNIRQVFSDIGVDIRFEGELPFNENHTKLFIDIIREGSTNAVRHGFATQINIKVKSIENAYNLTIKNNGYITTNPIVPSGGLEVIRKKVCELGGSLDIIYYPMFTLSVVLPGGEFYDKSTYS